MSADKKKHSFEGIGRILKNSLAECGARRPKKESPHHHITPPVKPVKIEEEDELQNPLILQALQNIGSHNKGETKEKLGKVFPNEKEFISQPGYEQKADFQTPSHTGEAISDSSHKHLQSVQNRDEDKEISRGHFRNREACSDHEKGTQKGSRARAWHFPNKQETSNSRPKEWLGSSKDHRSDAYVDNRRDNLPSRLRGRIGQVGSNPNTEIHHEERSRFEGKRHEQPRRLMAMTFTNQKLSAVPPNEEDWETEINAPQNHELKTYLSDDDSNSQNHDSIQEVPDSEYRDENKAKTETDLTEASEPENKENSIDDYGMGTSAMEKIQRLFATYTSPGKNEDSIRGILKTLPNGESSSSHCVKRSEHSGDMVPSVDSVGSKYPVVNFGDVQNEKCDKAVTDEGHTVIREHQLTVVDTDKSCDDTDTVLVDSHINEDRHKPKSTINTQEINYKDQSPIHRDPSLKHLTKSPGSIPSGFSSDYDASGISQSDADDESRESPDSVVANLFPSEDHHSDHEEPLPSHWHDRAYVRQPMPQQQMPQWYPHPPYYPEQPYCNQYPYMPQQPYPPFMGFDPSSFAHQYPRSSPSHATSLTVPAETFPHTDSMNNVVAFVENKMKEWNAFTSHHHGQAVPVDVVISVVLSGTRDGQGAQDIPVSNPSGVQCSYPSGMWQAPVPMSHPNAGGYFHPMWQQQHGYPYTRENSHPDTVSVPPSNDIVDMTKPPTGDIVPKPLSSEMPRPPTSDISKPPPSDHHLEVGVVGGDSQPSHGLEAQAEKITREKSQVEDEMKRRASLTYSDDDRIRSQERDSKTAKQCHRTGDGRRAEGNVNSVSNFLNPNDLKNSWSGRSKVHSASRRGAYNTPVEKSEQSFLYWKSQRRSDSESDQDDRKLDKSFDGDCSPHHARDKKERRSNEANEWLSVRGRNRGRDLSRDRFEPKETTTLSWAEQSPEPTPLLTDTVSSHDYHKSSHRRRSDSVVSYGSDERSTMARDNRLCKTPGGRRDGRQKTWDDGCSWMTSLLRRSKTYNHQFIDTHCHIDFMYHRTDTPTMPFKCYVDKHVDSFPVNYEGCVAIFCNPKVFNESTPAHAILQLLAKEDKVWVAVGCHPKNATDFRDQHLYRLRRILRVHPKIVALGEIGLDYSGSFHRHADRQKEVFVQQLQLAVELKLPLVIHCRDADDDCLKIMKEEVPVNHKIHLHCFTRNIRVAREWMEYFPNLFIGFTPVITYASAKDATHAAEMIPLNRLLLETDAPYFVPAGVPSGQVKGVSHPGFALFTAERLAEVKGVSVDQVLEACRRNTRTVYGI